MSLAPFLICGDVKAKYISELCMKNEITTVESL